MPREIEKIVLPDSHTLSEEGAKIFNTSAIEAVNHRGCFTVAISGGSTPRTMHRLLAKEPHSSQIPWHRIHLFWVDERMVAFDHPHSNFGAAQKDFLDNVPIALDQVHPMPAMISPDKGVTLYETELKRYFDGLHSHLPRFDLITLGMGEDGHIASLFPGQHSTASELWVLSVKGGNPNLYRLTLTYFVLNNARRILFLVSGKNKAKIVKTVFENRQTLLPASRIQPLNGDITWLLDRDAASLL
ncbi:MAG: 6-phosphogluconolactonase [Desulfobacterales bacterium]|nr:MAG: 6-phosphogluconolactonase [Desulfobacterales bacterium]